MDVSNSFVITDYLNSADYARNIESPLNCRTKIVFWRPLHLLSLLGVVVAAEIAIIWWGSLCMIFP